MDFLIGYGLLITAFVSDRQIPIAAYMKKSLSNYITHYFDIWHLKKELRYGYTISKWLLWPGEIKCARRKTIKAILTNGAILRGPN